MAEQPYDYSQWLPGLRYAESRGEQDPYNAVGDGGQARGAYQLHPIMYRDIQRVYPKVWGQRTYEQVLATPATQDAVAMDGLRMLREHYGLQKDDHMVSGWNTGPTQARKGIRNQKYIDTVRQGMRKGKPPMQWFK